MRPVEYEEGFEDASVYQYENPYDFFDQYIEHFQYCIGYQAGIHAYNEVNYPTGWLNTQIESAKDTVSKWSDNLKKAMLVD